MKRKTSPPRAISLRPRFRIISGPDVAFGPGKAELLALIVRTGSINQAAKSMGMSYMRAWSLVQTMNRSFQEPLVLAAHGGRHGGGAALTPTGRRLLALYRQMEKNSLNVVQPAWRTLRKLLRH